MTNTDDAPATKADVSANRRWIIGIVISVVFGTFGAVMAYLSYTHSHDESSRGTSRPAADPQRSPQPESAPAPDRGDGKHGRDRKNN